MASMWIDGTLVSAERTLVGPVPGWSPSDDEARAFRFAAFVPLLSDSVHPGPPTSG